VLVEVVALVEVEAVALVAAVVALPRDGDSTRPAWTNTTGI
jgi:hypothetical protein